MQIIFNGEEQYNGPSENERKINEGINKIIHIEVERRTKELEEEYKKLKSDWLNRKITFMEFIYTAIVYGLFWLLVVVFIEVIF